MVGGRRRIDNLPQTLANLGDEDPIISWCTSRTWPRRAGARVATLAGHTHGGQVNLFGYIPSSRRASGALRHGHRRGGRHLVVSAGLGCSWWPVRRRAARDRPGRLVSA
jgi:hypothetical protein